MYSIGCLLDKEKSADKNTYIRRDAHGASDSYKHNKGCKSGLQPLLFIITKLTDTYYFTTYQISVVPL